MWIIMGNLVYLQRVMKVSILSLVSGGGVSVIQLSNKMILSFSSSVNPFQNVIDFGIVHFFHFSSSDMLHIT